VARAAARVAALRRQGFPYVVAGDIRAYFESIPHERLIGKLERLVDDRPLVDLIWLWLETYSRTGRGVPQGAPLSPLLANLLATIESRVHGRNGHGRSNDSISPDTILTTST
jgi:CRISPR-associated protein Cas1